MYFTGEKNGTSENVAARKKIRNFPKNNVISVKKVIEAHLLHLTKCLTL